MRVARKVSEYPSNPFGKKPRAFLVGGFVRDLLLGDISATDADLEIYGIPVELLEAMIRPLFPEAPVSTVGKAFGVIEVSLGKGLELDIALPRHESKVAEGHRGFAIMGDPNLDVEQAANRRDFTINAMSFDPLTGDLMDPMHGTFDLEERILRVVDAETFIDDPLRAARAIQFVGRFGLTVEPASLILLKKIVASQDFRSLSAERMTEEWRKLFFKAEFPSRGLQLAQDIGLKDFPFSYAADSCAFICRKQQLMGDDYLEAMLATVFDGWTDEQVMETFHKTVFSRSVEEGVMHLRTQLALISQIEVTINGMRIFLKRLAPASLASFFAVAEATGKLAPAQAKRWRSFITEHDIETAAKTPLLRGQDLIEIGLPTGPRIGELIDAIEEMRDQGELVTREQALHTVKEKIATYAHPSSSKSKKSVSR